MFRIILLLTLSLSLCACGGGDPEDNPLPEDAQKTAPAPNCDTSQSLCR